MRRMVRVVVVAALSFVLGAWCVEATAQTWDLAADFLLSPHQANPSPDSYGNANVWAYLEGALLASGYPLYPVPSSLTLLPEFVSNVSSIVGLEQWQAASGDASTNNPPAVGINATGATQTIGSLTWPTDIIRMEPTVNRVAAIRWRSPIAATVRYVLATVDLNPACGNPTHWLLYQNDILYRDVAVASTYIFDIQQVPVQIGDDLTFMLIRRFPENGPDPVGCAATALGLTIAPIQTVTIDIRPGTFPNDINTRSRGQIPVAILSTRDFDAPREVDPSSLTFGSTGNEASLTACSPGGEDVNGDGLSDLVCRFTTSLTGFAVGDTVGRLQAQALDGTLLFGSDSVNVVH